MRITSITALLFVLIFVIGCSTTMTIKAVGKADDYNELFIGDIAK